MARTTIGTPARLAVRHECSARISVHCTLGNGQPKRRTCAHCGSAFYVTSGLWGVFTWTGDGRYPEENARETFARESAAQSWCDARPDANVVVRWVAA